MFRFFCSRCAGSALAQYSGRVGSQVQKEMTHKLATESRVSVLGRVLATLDLEPPVSEILERVLASKVLEELATADGSDSGESLAVVTPEQLGEVDELRPAESELALEVREEVALDVLVVVEHVAIDASAAEKKDVRVVRHDPVDEVALEELRAFGFGFFWSVDVRDPEKREHVLCVGGQSQVVDFKLQEINTP